jgi:uncharacterized protein (TIGR02118 family)
MRGPSMLQLTVLYNHPEDQGAFDRHYDDVHAPLAMKMPGLRRFTVTRPGPDANGNTPAYHLIAVLEFDDEVALGNAMSSPEGQAAVADMANFAGAGATTLTGTAQTLV